MPGGSLISLTSYGSQNVLLNGNPDFTFFYKVFKKYSHFATESVSIPLDGPTELFYDQEVTVRAKIPRVTDLVSDMCLLIDLPDIYSKYIDISAGSPRQAQYEFQWVKAPAVHMIKKISFLMGGTSVQEFDGEYIYARAQLDQDSDTLEKWRALVGDVPELVDPAKGIYAGGSQAIGYPSVVRDVTQTQQINRPSIFGRTLRVPLPFWFSESSFKALPLVALQYHECYVEVTLRRLQEMYTVLDPTGLRVRPGMKLDAMLGVNEPDYVADNDQNVEIRNFYVDHGFTVPALNNLSVNPRLEATYVSVTDEERKVFANFPLTYLMSQVRRYRLDNITGRQLFDLEVSNPITRLIILPRRSDSYDDRNQPFNYTNWWNYPAAPFTPTPGASPIVNTVFSSGVLVPATQDQIIRGMRLLLNGVEYQESKGSGYYTELTQFNTCKGGHTKEARYMHIFPFALDPPGEQPSGSVNASVIRLFQLEIDPYPLPANPTYVYNVNVYVESYNVVNIASGLGGLKYAY